MKIKILSVLLILTSLFSFGQEKLDLDKAIKTALENNYDIRIQKGNVEIAENNNSLGEAGYMPNVQLQVGQNNTVTDNVKIANPFQLQGQINSYSVSPQILLNWDIFRGFSAHINKKRLETLQKEAAGNADITISNTVQAVILGYYRVIIEKEGLKEFEKQLRLSRDRYSYLKMKSELGTAVTNEVLLEQTNYLTDSANYINQQLVYENAVRDLNFIMAVEDVSKNYIFEEDLEFTPHSYTYAQLQDEMYGNNVDLKKQYLTQQVMNENLSLRRAERLPSLNLNAGFTDNRSINDLSNAYQVGQDGSTQYGPSEPLSAVTDRYFANFTLSFTLFNGGRINRAIENTLITTDIQNISTNKLKNALNRDLAKAVAQYDVVKRLYYINEKKEEVAKQNLEISREKFRNGTINSFDFRTVQNNYLSSSILKLRSIFNLIDAEVGILRLTGGLLDQVD